MKRLALVSFAALAWAQAAQAQQTTITPDTAAGLGFGTTVGNSGSTYTIDGGTVSGSNLFHSFSQFDLGAGDVAQWVYSGGDPATIGNVINRVTGGTASSIYGMLDSTAIPNADFYFINPAGIVFGADAAVNVPAAAYFSTASELNFADGRTMSVATPSGSTLSVAAPESFGFLGGEGDISASDIGYGDRPFVTSSGALSLSAANVWLDNAFVGSQALDMTAVGDSPIQVGVDGGWTDGPADGQIEINNSWLQTWPGDCYENCLGTQGHISLYGGDLAIEYSGVVADFDSATDDGGISYVELLGENSISINGSSILADGYGIADAGSITIRSLGDVAIWDSAVSTYTDGSGRAGAINVEGAEVDVNATYITSESYGDGPAGDIDIAGDLIVLRGGSLVQSTANGDGAAGFVALQGDEVWIDEGSSVSTASSTDAPAGDIVISADLLTITGSSSVSSTSFGNGSGGNIIIEATEMELSGASAIASDAYGDGDAGFVSVDVLDELSIGSASYISSDSGIAGDIDALGWSGDIFITAGTLSMDGGFVLSRAFASGNSGSISVEADDIDMELSVLSTDAHYGDAGSISIFADSASLDGSSLSSDAFGGNGGDIFLDIAGDLNLVDSQISTNAGESVGSIDFGDGGNIGIVAESLAMDFSDITSRADGQGSGGSIDITLDGPLTLYGSRIFADTYGDGDAGSISVLASDAQLEFSQVSSDSYGAGFAGFVGLDISGELYAADGFISSDSLGLGDAGGVLVSAGSLYLDDASISSDALGRGNGGISEVDVTGEIYMTNGAYISSDSLQSGDAGGVFVTADSLLLDGGYISSDAYRDGDAGLTSVEVAGELTLQGNSYISSDALGDGEGGGVFVDADLLHIFGPSEITSDAWGNGDAGILLLDAGQLQMDDGASISASSSGAGDAFGVLITADSVILNDSQIVSDANGTGDAGGVFMEVASLSMTNSLVRSEAASTGFGGLISIEATGDVSLANSTIATNANGSGDAGDVDVVAHLLSLADGSAISSDANSPLGGESGIVTVAADELRMSGASTISTKSANANPAGFIFLELGELWMEGGGTAISSENTSDVAGDAGSIGIEADNATIAEGARITTNSAAGAAGDIDLAIAAGGLLKLIGVNLPGIIETSSGPGTGGIITIESALAIISNGGVISALGDSGGANVHIDTQYFIASSDRPNIVQVNGTLTFSNAIYDVSAGTTDVDLSMLDASGVLQGQCSSVHSTGRVSQLNIRPSGPFASPGWSTLQMPKPVPGTPIGGCQ